MSKVFTVAWREFRHTVLRPVFIIAVLGIPLLILGAIVVAALMTIQHEEPPLVGKIAVIDPAGDVAEAARLEFSPEEIRADDIRAMQHAQEAAEEITGGMGMGMAGPGAVSTPATALQRGEVRVEIESIQSDPAVVLDSQKERLRAGDLLAVVAIYPETMQVARTASGKGEQKVGGAQAESESKSEEQRAALEPNTFQLFVAEKMDSDHVGLIERRIGEAVVRVRARQSGFEPDEIMAILRRPSAQTSRALATGEEAESSELKRGIRQMIPMVFMMLIWIGALTSSQHLMLSTIEEKSNKVMEVLLSAVSPFQLMTGKIVGYGGVGLLIVLIYSSLGIASLIALASVTEWVSYIDLLYLAIFYLMGYFMIASMMAAVGSAVSDIREANTLMTPVMLVVVAPMILWLPISQDPNGPIATICSFIPPAIPFAMILRLVAEEPVPFWQIPASIVWGYICVFAMVWGAARIFRVGVLMTGKPPSPLQLLKWIRYA